MGLRKILLGALFAICAVAIAAEDARAFWGSRGSYGSYGGSWGSRGSHGSYGGIRISRGSWGSRGSYGSCGSHGGIFRRLRGSHGSYGSHGSAGSHGSHGSHGGHGVSHHYGGHHAARAQATASPSYALKQTAPAKTTLMLHVPADARVSLAGVQTKQTGEVREFTTMQLSAGQAWKNYTVHVELERDGETFAEDRTITLTGGTSQELSVEFADPLQVAKL